MKCMQINGIVIDREVNFTAIYNENEYVFTYMPYSKYKEYKFDLLNSEIIEPCGTVVVYPSMGNNSIEVYYIKIFISLLYFAYRIEIEEKQKEAYMETERKDFLNISQELLEKRYRQRESSVMKNWNIRGFWCGDHIERIHWCIKLGKKEMSCDDFESYLSRGYGADLCDSYDRRYKFEPYVQRIDLNNHILKKVDILNSMIKKDSIIGNKLKSAMRLYYEVFMIYTNMNLSIITISTIMETLLLGKDEDNQRKKVAVRSACIICDGMERKWKTSIAEAVYWFYKYRNAIVHDGKSYLDFEEILLNNVVENMKHIIFEIIHFYYENRLENINDIRQIVTKNQRCDGLENAFDYLSPDAGKKYNFLLSED